MRIKILKIFIFLCLLIFLSQVFSKIVNASGTCSTDCKISNCNIDCTNSCGKACCKCLLGEDGYCGCGSNVITDCGLDDFNTCTQDGRWCDHSSYTPHDRDESPQICVASSLTCTPYLWNIGGDISTCCGDDRDEYVRSMESGYDESWRRFMSGDNPSDNACCNRATDCVYQDRCYPAGDAPDCTNKIDSERCKYSGFGGNDNIAFCAWGTWYDCDSNSGDCSDKCGLPWLPTGETGNIGEYDSGHTTSCCGDDSGEIRVVSTGYGNDGTQACCNSADKCVYESKCRANGAAHPTNGNVHCEYGCWVPNDKLYSDITAYPPKCSSYGPESAYQYRNYYCENGNIDCQVTYDSSIESVTVSGEPCEETSTLIGDINGDGCVDIYDSILLNNAYNSQPGDPNWNAAADLNGDSVVDIYDAIILNQHFGEGDKC